MGVTLAYVSPVHPSLVWEHGPSGDLLIQLPPPRLGKKVAAVVGVALCLIAALGFGGLVAIDLVRQKGPTVEIMGPSLLAGVMTAWVLHRVLRLSLVLHRLGAMPSTLCVTRDVLRVHAPHDRVAEDWSFQPSRVADITVCNGRLSICLHDGVVADVAVPTPDSTLYPHLEAALRDALHLPALRGGPPRFTHAAVIPTVCVDELDT